MNDRSVADLHRRDPRGIGHLARRCLPAVGVLAVVVCVPLSGLDAAAPAAGASGAVALDAAAAARVTISVRLGASGKGRFSLTGGFTDSGRVSAKRSRAGGRLRLTQTMTGADGTLVISSSHACARASGKWSVVSGTRSYRGASGGGAVTGRIGCARPWQPSALVYTGSLTVPPPPLAPPGLYSGFTTQDNGIAFEVAPSGRAVVNLEVDAYSFKCVSPSGFSLTVFRDDHEAAGPFPIADDRTLVVQLVPGTTFSGNFTAAGAAGTVSVDSSIPDPFGQQAKCDAKIPWTVTTPPPPLRRALPGTYCGFTTSQHGVCLDVPEGGREFRNLRTTAVLRCGADVFFLLELTADVTVPFRANLSFDHRFTQPIPGGDPVTAFLRGSFDQAGATTGTLTLSRPSFTFEGTRYTCSGGGATWTAKLQR